MPLPWKKVKKTSISQLVKEHVHSQRNSGSPLMVETGFPTSLVDLFVKNRSRFKKPSKKKNPPPPTPDPLYCPSPSPSPPPPPSPINSPPRSSILNSESRVDEISPLIREKEETDKMKTEQGRSNSGVTMNQGLVAVFKMFLVVVLVLGMNNLVAGITVSAFLLFFLEYVGEHLYGLVKSFSAVQRRVLEMFSAKVVELEEDDDCVFKAPTPQQQELGCSDFGCKIQEIEVVEETEFVQGEEDVEGAVMEKEEEFRCETKGKKSHKAKMKSKMKKLVPKKFRKKKGSVLGSHMTPNDEVGGVIEGNKEIGGSREGKSNSDCLVSSLASGLDDNSSVVEAVDSVQGSFKGVDNATTVAKEDAVTESEHNSMYIVLLLVVLVGLVGGRLLALLFTITCCLITKRREGIIIRYTKKLPVVRSFAEMLG